MKKNFLLGSLLFAVLLSRAQTVANFENLTLAPDTFWNGLNGSGGFNSGEGYFVNSYNALGVSPFWSGFAYSNMYGDTALQTDSPLVNSMVYSAVTSSGFGGSGNYAVGHDDGNTKVYLGGNGKGGVVSGFYVTNTTYDFLSMRHGDTSEPAFSYSSMDTFVLNVTGWYQGASIGDTVQFYLADFRDSIYAPADTGTLILSTDTVIEDSVDTTIIDTEIVITPASLTISPGILTSWQWVDLSGLGNVDSLTFFLVSSQNGQYGINTPAYFAMDNFTTSDMVDNFITINYLQDTLLGVWSFFRDSSVLPGPYTVSVVAGPNVDGATATILDDSIWYLPAAGIVTVDTITYAVCGANLQCITAQVIINITGLSGIEDVSANFNVAHVFPNPFSHSFKVSYAGDLKEIRLYDLEGSLLKTITSGPVADVIEIDASTLAAGIYELRVITSDGVATVKVVKQ